MIVTRGEPAEAGDDHDLDLISSGERRGLYVTDRERVSKALLLASCVLTVVFFLIVLLWPRTQHVRAVFLPKKTRTIVIPEMQLETPRAPEGADRARSAHGGT